MERTKIKICGLFRKEDIRFVNEAKPDFCGFIINFPKSHRNLTPDRVRELVKDLDPGIIPVGVFVDEPVESVAALLQDGTIKMAQLHGHEDADYIRRLKTFGDYPLIKAFRDEDFSEVEACIADYVLLDRGNGKIGGTGETFDWEKTKAIQRPFFLAGGLGPDNLAAALEQVRPFAVDLSSKVETDRIKDPKKIMAAVNIVKGE